jgi:hypothetical protein
LLLPPRLRGRAQAPGGLVRDAAKNDRKKQIR